MTPDQPLAAQPWRTSSFCDTARQCIEVAHDSHACLVRDTANRGGTQLAVNPRAWAAFTRRVRNGGFPAAN